MTFQSVYDFILAWQTLIGSLLALGAALWTVWAMHDQARSDDTRHQNDRARKKMAARARTPDALSEMSAYVRSAGKSLVIDEKRPLPPVAALTTLKDTIEHIDTKQAEQTFELVSWYQVQHSRLMGSDKPKKSNETKCSTISPFSELKSIGFLIMRETSLSKSDLSNPHARKWWEALRMP
ncbi:hypothetical protein [Rhizobium leguminosarum]|uniref:hypothetical protein n=1 Tax=Rhizobium leguminosarum TaxID=384 RepID=UPI0021BBC077|nr:hypothetical protein [Rhizobium leguminosarum]